MARRHTREIEVELRGLGTQLKLAKPPKGVRVLAGEVQNLLCSKRLNAAEQVMDELMRDLLPAEVYEAHVAMRVGSYSTAICRLDSLLNPSPAATATKLPEKPKPLETAIP